MVKRVSGFALQVRTIEQNQMDSETRNSKPESRNSKPETHNPKKTCQHQEDHF